MRILVLCSFALSWFSAFAQQQTTVYFEFDRSALTEKEKKTLTDWAQLNPQAQVTKILGYCDAKGSDVYNDSLSLARATTVVDFLRAAQVQFSANFEVKGYGENFAQSQDMWQNRKVSVIFDNKPNEVVAPVSEKLGDKLRNAVAGDKIKLENFNFFNMSDRIVPKSRPLLGELLKVLQENPDLRIEIQGHICCQTNKDSDLSSISTLRAKAIYTYLVDNGISGERLSYKGYGVSRPIHPIPEKSEKEEDENRRVEILVVEK